MRAKQFTRDIIDTIGKRIFEVFIPINKDRNLRERVTQETRKVIKERIDLRDRAKKLVFKLEGIMKPREEEIELIDEI